ncbi:type II secretion system minor pseudopilin GspI [Limnobacter sp.]|uniref:type II secretion system minor pseudopilin GspI n=1 Tax=Limnobacter sp. TaxID=2003368 RepID=UPI0035170A4A
MQRHWRPHRGFTLIEALVAMTIIAVALIACLKAAGNLNLQQDEMIKRQYAQWSANNVANYIRVAGLYPNAQTASQQCPQANFQLVCVVTVSNTPNPNFRRVEIVVREALSGPGGNDLARLVVFLSSAP